MKRKIFPILISLIVLTGCDTFIDWIPENFAPFLKEEQNQNQTQDEDQKTLYSIKVTTLPTKTDYLIGEPFDPTGMVVVAKYSDRSEEKITNYNYSTANFLEVGTINFDIVYQGKTDSITLYVREERQTVEDEYTKEILTSGSSFAANFHSGYDFNNADHKIELSNYFDDQVEYLDLITKVESDNLHTQKFKSETYLQFGSGSNAEGSLKWFSVEKIYRVEINVLCYAKEDTYHGFTNVDNWSHIAIDNEDHDLTFSTGGDPELKTFAIDYPQGVTSFTVKSSMGRVYMKSMKITWRG